DRTRRLLSSEEVYCRGNDRGEPWRHREPGPNHPWHESENDGQIRQTLQRTVRHSVASRRRSEAQVLGEFGLDRRPLSLFTRRHERPPKVAACGAEPNVKGSCECQEPRRLEVQVSAPSVLV